MTAIEEIKASLTELIEAIDGNGINGDYLVAGRDKGDAALSRLAELKAEPIVAIDYTVLYDYAQHMNLAYNELCRVVHSALAVDHTNPAAAPPFARDSWQHAVDDHLSALGRTSQEFASSHEALAWLLAAHAQIVHDLADHAAAPQVPAGWQMVPIEPTPGMVEAGWLAYLNGSDDHRGDFATGYRAMLSAAPKEPTHSDGVKGRTK